MRPTRVRHVVLWLTVAAYMITYMDRVVISAALPVIQRELGFTLVTMGWILGAVRFGRPDPGGMAGRPNRTAPRTDPHCHLVEPLHLRHRPYLERVVHG